MNYLLDTNIISEVRKGPRCNSRVATWYELIDDFRNLSSVLVSAKSARASSALDKTPAQVRALENWLAALATSFAQRILPIDQAVADEWGRMIASRPVSTIDALLAATAKVNNMTLVTRNTIDVADLGAKVLNPFEARE